MIAVTLMAFALVGVARAGRREFAYLRARRTGAELQAQVVDTLASPSRRAAGTYDVTPIVRYHLGERTYEATIVNASSVPQERGDSMTVVVSEDSPYEPYDRYQGMGAKARGSFALFALAVVVLLMALAAL
ncbi:DUF3592 domain-containing protein [Actinomadura sp. DC4]|uniref:DUF3592 domain-containing protein n=1 Tax=Actinomadura sp. DC4 TaxID=3055069 RepID=UPI0025B252CE|nr:DUF3592 domain-containing protein [Actinomadura sp. DC4]